MLKISLRHYGYEVVTASDGYEALVQYKANQGRFGAIITEHAMRRMNGLKFVRAVQEAGYAGRIIVMSRRLQWEEVKEYKCHAVSGFFHTPFDMGMLATMLLQTG
jgi:DNA-binding NtrC family response regulator